MQSNYTTLIRYQDPIRTEYCWANYKTATSLFYTMPSWWYIPSGTSALKTAVPKASQLLAIYFYGQTFSEKTTYFYRNPNPPLITTSDTKPQTSSFGHLYLGRDISQARPSQVLTWKRTQLPAQQFPLLRDQTPLDLQGDCTSTPISNPRFACLEACLTHFARAPILLTMQ